MGPPLFFYAYGSVWQAAIATAAGVMRTADGGGVHLASEMCPEEDHQERKCTSVRRAGARAQTYWTSDLPSVPHKAPVFV